MSKQTVPTIIKIDVLGKAESEGLYVIGRVGDVVLAINSTEGGMPSSFNADPDTEDEYFYCVRGSVHILFKYGDQDLPSIDLVAGEFLTIPAGVLISGTTSDDAVLLVLERAKPWHA